VTRATSLRVVDYAAAIEFFFAPGPADARTPDAVVNAAPARRLRDALEPVAMHGVWAEPVNTALAGLGIDDFLIAYVTGRGSPLGETPGAVVAATFGVFEPGVIIQLWEAGLATAKLPEVVAVRDRATADSLRATIGDIAPEDEVTRVAEVLERAVTAVDGTGRALFAALRAQPRLTDPYGRLWRAADLVREHRGDSHIAASVAAGLDPVRMGILSEVWVGYPVGEYSGTRAWPQEASDAGLARLEADGLIAQGTITDRGRAVRDAIEDATDLAQRDLLEAVGDDLDTIVERLDAWSQRCVEAGAFPPDPRKRAAG
jgi:hypothetical protein